MRFSKPLIIKPRRRIEVQQRGLATGRLVFVRRVKTIKPVVRKIEVKDVRGQ